MDVEVQMQWIPTHCRVESNEYLCEIAGKGSPVQTTIPIGLNSASAKIDQIIGLTMEEAEYQEGVNKSRPGRTAQWYLEYTGEKIPKWTTTLTDIERKKSPTPANMWETHRRT